MRRYRCVRLIEIQSIKYIIQNSHNRKYLVNVFFIEDKIHVQHVYNACSA